MSWNLVWICFFCWPPSWPNFIKIGDGSAKKCISWHGITHNWQYGHIGLSCNIKPGDLSYANLYVALNEDLSRRIFSYWLLNISFWIIQKVQFLWDIACTMILIKTKAFFNDSWWDSTEYWLNCQLWIQKLTSQQWVNC